ncbi:hypothetical protein K0504_12060 [Neiella marina]|uniref:HTH cro/C1-type domain-containing protein n=1 Tax=Neiella holothuriorum TaxID=2870530 RepID=A0ABS7EJ33_9GAMM|nr:hypothetical protein [Neiella holothuriorum]MBW8191771.1 hypothetical protein [Neiella holothuriorum]
MDDKLKQEVLARWMKDWQLRSKDAAAILAVSQSKLSEYLSGKRKVPRYVVSHIDTLSVLSKKQAQALIKRRTDNR